MSENPPGNEYADDFDPLQAFIALFKDVDGIGERAGPAADLTLEERLQAHIIDGEKDGLAGALEEALLSYPALVIINDHLLAGMKTVGELFGSGQMQLPFVLQSAEVMKTAVTHLEPHMDRVEGESKGIVVLATVKGDVHDIGKNLVDIILTNNGYTVHNLGIKQPISEIVAAWERTNADAIGLSGLLVKSVNVMEDNLRELNEQGIDVPVILGGAALTRHYAESHLRSVYHGTCLYGKDAFEGLRVMDHIVDDRVDELEIEITGRLDKRAAVERTVAAPAGATGVSEQPARSEVRRGAPPPDAPFLGSRVVEDIDLADVYGFINTVALFRGQWQFKRGRRSESEYEASLQADVLPIFERLKERCRSEAILQPKVVYGYFPCASDGEDLIIFDPDEPQREVERFTFPRQAGRRRLCISDFFRDLGEVERADAPDVLGMSCVTVGERASEVARELFEGDEYAEYLYLHGFGVECAEALAELWHKRMRQELGIGVDDSPKTRDLFTQKYRGSRFSFGYPACPEMSDQGKLFRLLRPDRIGCVLTENWQIDPEQSTSAIIVHHPDAKYFNA